MTDQQLLARLLIGATDDIERYRKALREIATGPYQYYAGNVQDIARAALGDPWPTREAQPFNPREDERAQAKAKAPAPGWTAQDDLDRSVKPTGPFAQGIAHP